MNTKSHVTIWLVFNDGQWYHAFGCDRDALAYVKRVAAKQFTVVEVEKDVEYTYGYFTFKRVELKQYVMSIYDDEPHRTSLAEEVESKIAQRKIEIYDAPTVKSNPWTGN